MTDDHRQSEQRVQTNTEDEFCAAAAVLTLCEQRTGPADVVEGESAGPVHSSDVGC